jgi:hypothetical protein
MFYRYFYDDSGNILMTATVRAPMGQPLRAIPMGPTEQYVDSEQRYDPDQYQVDVTTNTLVAKSQ